MGSGIADESLIEAVADASGLSSIFAAHTITRACERSNVDPKALSPASLRKALPEIERGIRGFHDAKSLAVAMARIKGLCG